MPPEANPSRSNFDLLRLLAAGVFVAGNGLILTGGAVPGVWGAPLPRIGLDMLFALVARRFRVAALAGRPRCPGTSSESRP